MPEDTVSPQGSRTSAEERNIATFRMLQEEVINNRRLDLVEQVFAPTFHTEREAFAALNRVAGRPGYPAGDVYEAFRTNLGRHLDTFADQVRTIQAIHADGDTVWARWTVEAVHAAEFKGIPATGKTIRFTEVAQVRFDDDARMVWGWFLSNELELALELGLTVS